MAEERIFVGRKDELEKFGRVLEDPKGQAVLVVGQVGMGKTWLINKMAEVAENHPDLKCGWVRYELTANDSVDAVMERMMDDAFRAGEVVEGSFDSTAKRRKQWFALLETMVPKGEKIAKLIQSLERESKRPTREEFIERLRLISKKMKNDGRAVFVIDPLEYLNKGCAGDWAIVIRDLPEKVKFVFAQREDDVLAGYRKFAGLKNVIQIPEKKLGALDEGAVDKLIKLRADETEYTVEELKEGLGWYKGHPYAVQGAVDLLQTGKKLEELPDDPTETGVVEEQWEKVCGYGDEAIRMFKAYAILEEAVGDDVIEKVAEVKPNARLSLLAKNVFLRKLFHEEGESKRIYHLLLANYILKRMSDGESKEYHGRAVGVYREKLAEAEKKQTKPDALAAMRLAEHVLEAEGKVAFVYAFVNECTQPLVNLGLLDAAIALAERALGVVEKGSKEEATVRGNLGLVYQTRGDLDKAEEMHKKALEIHERLDDQEGKAKDYGNLGLIYETRGDLDKAEEMFREGLQIDKKLGRLEGMAAKYGNLGLVYQTRGELDKAEEMHKKALEFEEKIGRLGGMARQYGNLGLIYRRRGDLDKAEGMHKKALEIDEQLGLKEGMASDYAALGLVYKERGDFGKAEEWHKKGLKIEKKLGSKEGMARQYGNLGVIYLKRGELNKAEEMFTKILDIHKKLGHKEGMANDYANLGMVYKQRGDVKKAREYGEKALGFYKKIGMLHMVEEVQSWLDGLSEK